jgi:tetratricopeptide (TPR) repeat protein
MSERGWAAGRLDEIEGPRVRHGYDWHPVRRHFGIRSFGVNANVARESSDILVDEHDETGGDGGQEELYVVLRGRARFTVANEDVELGAGSFLFVRDPAVQRAATALEPDTVALAVGGRPGQAFVPSSWEHGRYAVELSERGDNDGAVRVMEQALEERPEHAGNLYNLACFESLAGRRDDALEHLRRSIELDASFRDYARDDDDFAPLRDDAEFQALVAT